MDTFTTMVGLTAMFFAYMGERFRTGAYLWLSALFSIIFALRMAEELFYMVTAGLLAVIGFRIYQSRTDVREESSDD